MTWGDMRTPFRWTASPRPLSVTASVIVGTQIRQCPRAGPKDLEILKAHRSGRRFDAAPIVWIELGGDPNKAIGTGIRQRSEQHGMDDAEDGGVGADAEREGAHDDRGEPRRAQERARRESRVLTEVAEPPERPGIAMEFLRLRNPAERASSRQAGLGIGQPPTLVLVLKDTEVRRQLAFELGLSAVRLEEMDETKQESSKSSHRYGSLSRRASTNPARRRHRSVSFASARVPALVML